MPYQQTGDEAGRGGIVANPPVLTSTVAAGATPTKAEFDALRADVVALRTNVADLITALRNSNTVD
jgi:hypothetical protein